ncbi:MAG: sulfite exporter TauE/SafE family protein [Candidatus Sumerlaeia bacterium]
MLDWIVPDSITVSPTVYIVLTMCATLLIGFSKAGFGGGIGVLATPLFLIALPDQSHIALSLILPLLIVCDIATLRHFPKEWHPRSYWLLLGGTILGLGVGLYFLLLFSRKDVDGDRWIRLIVGVVSILFCVMKIIPRKTKKELFEPGWKTGTLVGVLAAFTSMVAHAAGSLISMFLLPQKLDRRIFVGTCTRYFLTLNLLKVPCYLLATALSEGKDYITFSTLKWDLWLIPFGIAGVAFGAWLNKRMDGKIFTAIIYIFLAIAGVRMIYTSI